MAMRTATAMPALILLLGALLLLPGGLAEEGDDAAMAALLARIREVQDAGTGGLGELEKFSANSPQDLVGSAGVEDLDFTEEVAVEPHAAADLFAHILQMQQKVLESSERSEGEDEAVEGAGGDGEEEEKEEERENVELVGMDDPAGRERFEELEAALKSLADKGVGSEGESDAPGVLNVPGLKGEDVINLLHKYAYEMHEKIHAKGVGVDRDSPSEDDRGHPVDGENGEIYRGHNHDDHDHERAHVHEHGHHHHDHDHGHGHHHHEHGHGDAHANVGFSRASDAHSHNHDHKGHSHGHDHGDPFKKKKFVLPEEIAEEEDLLQYNFEGQVYSSAEQPNRWRGPEIGSFISFTVSFIFLFHLCGNCLTNNSSSIALEPLTKQAI